MQKDSQSITATVLIVKQLRTQLDKLDLIELHANVTLGTIGVPISLPASHHD